MTKNTYIIAEAGVNHNGSIAIAQNLIDIAVEAGADAVKFQTFNSETVISRYAPKADYQVKTTGSTETQLQMVKKLQLSDEEHFQLKNYCNKRNIQFLSTPFDLKSVELLVNQLNVPKIKISSGDITNGPLLLKAAMTGKEILLSTGMSTLGEIEDALGVIAFGYVFKNESPSCESFKQAYYSEIGQAALKNKVTLLHCTTEYPAPDHSVNLNALLTLEKAFGLTIGYSDHTVGSTIPIAAVALGAKVIEKHFTIDKSLPGPDHVASMEPHEFISLVKEIRRVEKALGSSLKLPAKEELSNKKIARKSLVAAKGISKGEEYTEDNLGIKRPGIGLSPMKYWNMLGRNAAKNYREDEVIE